MARLQRLGGSGSGIRFCKECRYLKADCQSAAGYQPAPHFRRQVINRLSTGYQPAPHSLLLLLGGLAFCFRFFMEDRGPVFGFHFGFRRWWFVGGGYADGYRQFTRGTAFEDAAAARSGGGVASP